MPSWQYLEPIAINITKLETPMPLTFKQFLVEQMEPTITNEQVRGWAEQVKTRLGLTAFDIWLSSNGYIKLNLIEVPKETRKTGVGSQAMMELCRLADKAKLRITLSPALKDPRHGTTSRSRLIEFYKRFGFKQNKGRNKDFTISDAMIRDPR